MRPREEVIYEGMSGVCAKTLALSHRTFYSHLLGLFDLANPSLSGCSSSYESAVEWGRILCRHTIFDDVYGVLFTAPLWTPNTSAS